MYYLPFLCFENPPKEYSESSLSFDQLVKSTKQFSMRVEPCIAKHGAMPGDRNVVNNASIVGNFIRDQSVQFCIQNIVQYEY